MSWVIALRHHGPVELALPRGATGFLSKGQEPLPDAMTRLALRVVHDTARAAGGSARNAETKGFRSFKTLLVTDVGVEGRQLWVLLHRIIPWMAVVDRDPEATIPIAPRVVDDLLDPDQVAEAGWRLLRRDESSIGLSDDALRSLSQAERGEIQHWRPATLGEVIFNHWD